MPPLPCLNEYLVNTAPRFSTSLLAISGVTTWTCSQAPLGPSPQLRPAPHALSCSAVGVFCEVRSSSSPNAVALEIFSQRESERLHGIDAQVSAPGGATRSVGAASHSAAAPPATGAMMASALSARRFRTDISILRLQACHELVRG